MAFEYKKKPIKIGTQIFDNPGRMLIGRVQGVGVIANWWDLLYFNMTLSRENSVPSY